MAPRSADPFKPPAQASYSKGEVNRAGQLLRRFYEQPAERFLENPFLDFDPRDVLDAMYKVTWWRLLHGPPLNKVAANLRYHVKAEGALVGHRIDVAQRLKRRATIIYKLEREPTMNLAQMADIGGVRARLPSIRHVHAVSRRLKKTWTIVRTRDYIEKPKASGYRALHHVVRRDGRLIEVQLRTILQDEWANQVEDDGRQLGMGFKFGSGNPDIHGYYGAMAEIFAAMDHGEPIGNDLAAELNKRFQKIKVALRR